MGGRRIKEACKCRECGKIIRKENKSGLCSHHYRIQHMQELRNYRKSKQLCVQCGKKVEPIIIYPAGDKVRPIIKIIKMPIRCYQCRQKQNKWQNDWIKNNKKT